MKLLIWNPVYVLGGGMNVLVNVVTSLHRHSEVDTLTVVLNTKYKEHPLPDWSTKVTVRYVDERCDSAHHLAGHDLVFVTWPHGISAPQTKLPVVCIYHDTILLDAYGAHSTKIFVECIEEEIRSLFNRFNQVLVTSNYTRQRLLQIAGERVSDRVSVIPLMGEVERTEPQSDSASSLPATLKGRKFFFYPANVAEHKNHLGLLLALSKRRNRDVCVALCGYRTELIGSNELTDNTYINKLNKMISDRKLIKGVDYVVLGYLDDASVDAIWENCLGLVMPTRGEGMGIPISEAIQRQVPVITSDLPVLREHFDRRSTSIVWIDPDCPGEIASALDCVTERHPEFLEKAKNNQSSGRTWEDIASEIYDTFKRISQTRPIEDAESLAKHRKRGFRSLLKSLTGQGTKTDK